MPMKINGQNPIIKKDGKNGMLYVGYDFNKDKRLDKVEGHFYLGDHTIPHFIVEEGTNSYFFNSLQEEYKKLF